MQKLTRIFSSGSLHFYTVYSLQYTIYLSRNINYMHVMLAKYAELASHLLLLQRERERREREREREEKERGERERGGKHARSVFSLINKI